MPRIALEFDLAFRTSTKELQKGLKTASGMMSDLTKSASQLTEEFAGNLTKKITEQFDRDSPVLKTFEKSLVDISTNIRDTVAKSTRNIGEGAINALQKAQFLQVSEGIEDINKAMGRLVQGFGAGDEMGKKMLADMTTGMASMTRTENLKYFNEFTKQAQNLRHYMADFTPQRFGLIATNFEKIQKTTLAIAEYQKRIADDTYKYKDRAAAALKVQEDLLKKYIQENDVLVKQGEAINKLKEKAKDFLNKGLQLAGITGWFSIIKRAAEVQTKAAQIAFKTGVGGIAQMNGAMGAFVANDDLYSQQVGKYASAMGNAMTQAAGNVAANTADISESWGELAAVRVRGTIGDMKELTEVSYSMQKAFGISSGEAASLIRDLKVIGGASTADVKRAAGALAGVQRELGLMPGEAREVTATVGVVMRQIRLFGGSAKQVNTVTKEVGKLVTTFGDVGLEASDATKLVQQMMDPTKMNENVMLWQGLGMSAQQGMQMMMGNGEQMAGMTDKMVDLAKRLKAQYGGNIFALQSMAEAYGLNLQQVQALSTADTRRTKAQIHDADIIKAGQAAQRGILDQLKRLWSSIAVIIDKAIVPAINVLSAILEPIVKGITAISAAFDTTNDKAGSFAMIMKTIGKFALPLVAFGLFKLVKGGGMLANLFGGRGLLGSVKGLIGKLPFIGKAFTKIEKGAGAAGLIDKAAKRGPGPLERFIKAVNKVKPGPMLAFAGAILMIAAGISMIILSIAVLAKALKDLNLQQLITLMVIVIVVLAGVIIMMKLLAGAARDLGAAGLEGAVGMIAMGLALLLIAGGIALIFVGMARFVEALADAQKAGANLWQVLAIVAVLLILVAVILFAFAYAAAAMAPVLITAGIALAVFGAGLLIVAAAAVLFAVAILLAAYGVKLMAEAFVIIGQNAELIAKGIAIVVPSIVALGAAMASVAATALPMIVAMAALVIGLFFLSLFALRAAIPLGIIAASVATVATMTDVAVGALGRLADAINSLPRGFGMRFAAEIGMMTAALLGFAAIGPIVAPMMAITAVFGALAPRVAPTTAGPAGDNNIGAAVDELKTANTHLSDISKYTNTTNAKLDGVIAAIRGMGSVPRLQANLTLNK
jgi:uncharacterized protein YukE